MVMILHRDDLLDQESRLDSAERETGSPRPLVAVLRHLRTVGAWFCRALAQPSGPLIFWAPGFRPWHSHIITRPEPAEIDETEPRDGGRMGA